MLVSSKRTRSSQDAGSNLDDRLHIKTPRTHLHTFASHSFDVRTTSRIPQGDEPDDVAGYAELIRA
jgi:hypothetical protein